MDTVVGAGVAVARQHSRKVLAFYFNMESAFKIKDLFHPKELLFLGENIFHLIEGHLVFKRANEVTEVVSL